MPGGKHGNRLVDDDFDDLDEDDYLEEEEEESELDPTVRSAYRPPVTGKARPAQPQIHNTAVNELLGQLIPGLYKGQSPGTSSQVGLQVEAAMSALRLINTRRHARRVDQPLCGSSSKQGLTAIQQTCQQVVPVQLWANSCRVHHPCAFLAESRRPVRDNSCCYVFCLSGPVHQHWIVKDSREQVRVQVCIS